MATPSIGQANQKATSSLLPGIPDAITLNEISPKLPWKVFYILSSVSQAWGHAIRGRKVYDASVLSPHSTETFVIVNLDSFRGGIALWSIRGNYLIKLPPIWHCSHHVVSSDGRIYLVGREEQGDSVVSSEVFALDVPAGETRWRECASMVQRRRFFGCAVIHGKIYVCGGDKGERIGAFSEFADQRCLSQEGSLVAHRTDG